MRVLFKSLLLTVGCIIFAAVIPYTVGILIPEPFRAPFILIATAFSTIVTGFASYTTFKIYKFLKASKQCELRRVNDPYELGSFIKKERFNYKVFSALSDIPNMLPPYSSVPGVYIYPEQMLNSSTVLLSSNADLRGPRSQSKFPLYIAKWPKDYKTPEEALNLKVKSKFDSGMHQKYLLTDAAQGKPLKSLSE